MADDAEPYTPHLDDLSAREDGDESWARRDPQSAVDWFETVIIYTRVRHARPQDRLGYDVPKDKMMVEVPLDLAETILECAKAGMAQGKKLRPSRIDRLAEAVAVYRGRKRKMELIAKAKASNTKLKATGADSAEDQAAQWASDLLFEKCGRRVSMTTMRRKMQQVR
jgi:hypothetical protein